MGGKPTSAEAMMKDKVAPIPAIRGTEIFDPFRTFGPAYELHPRSLAVHTWLHVLARSTKWAILEIPEMFVWRGR